MGLEVFFKSLAEPLSAVLSCPVHFIKHYKGLNVLESLKLVPSGAVLLLENVRFDPGEECNDLSFAKKIYLKDLISLLTKLFLVLIVLMLPLRELQIFCQV